MATIRKMKDHTIENVTLTDVDTILELAADLELTVETYEGVLNDLHIVYADKKLKVGSANPRNYIVCYYTYASPWSNSLHILLTDNFDNVIPYIPTEESE